MAREPAEKRAYVRYSARLAERIIDEVSTGRSLLEVCAMPGMPDRHSVRRWCIERPDFAERYEKGREWSAYALLDEIDDLVDRGQEIVEAAAKNGGSAQAAASVLREQLNVKRWKVGKLLPQYGERSQVELTGAGGKDLMPPEVDRTKLAHVLLTILREPSKLSEPAELPPSSAGIRFIDTPPSGTLLSAEPVEPEPEPEPALRPKFDTNGFLIEPSPPAPAPTPAELFALDRERERLSRVIGDEEAGAIQPRGRRRFTRIH
jgi:hypothetical protein